MYNISDLRITMRSSNLHLSFHIGGFKSVGITEFQDIQMIHCIQGSERNEGEDWKEDEGFYAVFKVSQ